jgi:hypothetical protein
MALSILVGSVWVGIHSGRGTPADLRDRDVAEPATAMAAVSGHAITSRSNADATARAATANPFAGTADPASRSTDGPTSSELLGDASLTPTAREDGARTDDGASEPSASGTSYPAASDAGMVDLVLAFDKGADLSGVRAEVEALGGEVTREYTQLPMRAVRVPADAVAALSQRADIVANVPDAPVMFLAQSSAQQTARLPAPTSPYYVQVASSVGVAVLDSGVAEHADLNVVEHINIVPPASYAAQTRADGTSPRSTSSTSVAAAPCTTAC